MEAIVGNGKAAGKRKIFYGWPLALIMGFMFFSSSGSYMSSAQLINPAMFADPNMSMTGTTLGIGFSTFTLVHGLGSPVVGWIISKIGAKWTIVIGATINLFGSLAMALFITEPIGYIIFFGVMMSFGVMMVGQISVQTTIGTWFIRNRGKAMTLTMTIGRLAGFIMPVAIGIAIAGGAWRNGWFIMAGLAVPAIILALLFVKNRPEDIGEVPDGSSTRSSEVQTEETEAAKSAKVYKNLEGMKFRDAIRKTKFWLISFAGAGSYICYGLVTSQGVLHFTTQGFDNVIVVSAISLMGAAMMAGNILIGVISDRVEPIRLIGFALIIEVVAILAAALIDSVIAVYFFYLAIGFAFGSIATNLPTTVANFFGRLELSKIIGLTLLIVGCSSSLVGVISGVLYDATGACVTAFILFAIIVLVCAIGSFFVRVPKKQD